MQKLLLLLILSFFSTQGFTASCPDGSEPTKTVSADGSYFEYKCLNEEPLPEIADETGYVVVLKEDFSKPFKYKKIKKNIYKYEYFMPSEPFWKAFRDSMKIENGQMTITIKPGTRQWDGDERNGTERAEWGFYLINEEKLISREKYFKVSYEFRLPVDSKKLFQNKRTLISQLKHDGGKYPGFSPASAFYVHKGGAATCVDYNNQRDDKSSQINNHTSIRETNIYDGKWHKVEFILKLGKEDGYCLVTIDEEKIIEKINYDNDLNPDEQLVAKFGAYRDDTDITQQITYDNIEVGYFNNSPLPVTNTTDSFKCKLGYIKSENKCVVFKLPANATLYSKDKGIWGCNYGYKKVDNSCVKL